MASIAMMVGGAIINAAAFTGGNVLAKYLSGDSGAMAEKTRHDKALEAYEAAQARYAQERTKLLDWIEVNRENKELAKQNFTNTDYAFKLYNQAHPSQKMTLPKEPKFFSKAGRAYFCRWQCARTQLCGFLFSLNFTAFE